MSDKLVEKYGITNFEARLCAVIKKKQAFLADIFAVMMK